MKFFNYLTRVGTDDHMDTEELHKYQLTNGIASIFILLSLPFCAITVWLYPDYTLLPAMCTVVYIACFPLNHFRLVDISRFLLSIVTPIALTIYHIYLLTPQEDFMPALYSFQFSFVFVPWIVYSMKEKKPLLFTNLIFLALITSFAVFNGQNDKGYDNSIFREGLMYHVCIYTAFVITVFSLYLLKLFNRQALDKNEVLIKEMEGQTRELIENTDRINQYVKEVEETQKKDRQRQWISEKLSDLQNLLRTAESFDDVKDRLLAQIVKNVEATQGALYVIEKTIDEQEVIEMTACYAYQRKKYLNRRYEPGEGIVGQCYLEKDQIFMDDIPQNYMTITSGLGKALPTSLMITPLIYNDRMEGIIELASFKRFESHEMEFLQQLSNILASFIHNIRISSQTKELLKEFRMQAEQLQVQEEENMQQLEEMTATQEEMKRKAEEYEKLLKNKSEEVNRLKALLKNHPALKEFSH